MIIVKTVGYLFLIAILLASVFLAILGIGWWNVAFHLGIVALSISGFLITTVVISFIVKPAIRINIILSIVSSLSAIYIFNLFLSVDAFKPNPTPILKTHIQAAIEAGIPFDNRSRMQVINHLREEGIDAQSVAFPDDAFFSDIVEDFPIQGQEKIWPLSGISEVTTVYCVETGQYMIYKSDKFGFNNPNSAYSQNKTRVILVGDSFTQGACVPSGEDLGGRLRDLGHNVINLGMGGNGPILQLAGIREYAQKLQPDLVLWILFENDLENLIREYQNEILRKYLSQESFTQNLADKQPLIDRFWLAVMECFERDPKSVYYP